MSKPSGAQQSSPSPFHSAAHSLIAMAEMISAAIGSMIDQPAPAASTATSAIAAWAAHSRFWRPSPAVASDPSCLARRSLAQPSSGISTIAEIVTTTPSTLACTSLPCSSRSADSYRKYGTSSKKEPATQRCAVRSLVAECVRDPVKRQMIVTDASPSTNDDAAQIMRLSESASTPAVSPITPSSVIQTSDAQDN
ncbi:MAG: hypothetical protein WKF48_12635 [Solirubrobacteraceae bacterium]